MVCIVKKITIQKLASRPPRTGVTGKHWVRPLVLARDSTDAILPEPLDLEDTTTKCGDDLKLVATARVC